MKISNEQKKILSFAAIVFVMLAIYIFPALYCMVLALFVLHHPVFAFLFTGIFFILLCYIPYRCIFKKINKPSLFVVISLCVIAFGLACVDNYYYNIYIPSITVVEQGVHSSNYKPFGESEYLVRLDEDASLKLQGDLPVIDGATALLPVYCSFAEAVYPECPAWHFKFEDEQKAIIEYSNTVGAYEALIKGERDIIFAAQPSKEQLENARNAGIELNLTPIGYEGFVFIVNQKNPVDSLTFEQIKDIYCGRVKNWKELGGNDWEIAPFQRNANSGSQTIFLHLMKDEDIIIPPKMHKVQDMGGLVDVVANYQNHKNAIGYSFRYYVQNMNYDANIKCLKINGVEPNKENIANRTYPLTDTFFAVTVKGHETENTKKFIEWILSSQGQEIVEKAGYIPLK